MFTGMEDRERRQLEDALRESEARFRALVQNSSDFITVLDPDGRVQYMSPAGTRVMGYTQDDLEGKAPTELIHEDDIDALIDQFADVVGRPGASGTVTYRGRHADGSYRQLEAIITNLLADPAVKGMVINTRDVTERRDVQRTLAESEQRYKSLFEHNPNAVYSFDLKGTFTSANPACETVSGYAVGDLVGSSFVSFIVPEDRDRAMESFRSAAAGEAQAVEIAIQHRHGHRVELHVTNMPIVVDWEIVGVYGVAKDVTERRELERQLEHRAFHDALTGLPNRALFMDRLGHALARRDRTPESVAVMFLDLDRFKIINDSLGHERGDVLLVAATGRVRRCLRVGDTLARHAGDEFTILIEDLHSTADAIALAERIVAELNVPFKLEGNEVMVTASIGIAVLEGGDEWAGRLLRKADVAMYRAKERGRNRYALFDADTAGRSLSRLDFEAELRAALERKEFVLHFQPNLAVATRTVVGVEALVRWMHPQRGLLAPAEFISIMEESGMIVSLGRYVIDAACAQARRWEERCPASAELFVAVNISALDLDHDDLVHHVTDALARHDLSPRRLVLEITERVIMEEPEVVMTTLDRLKAIGVQIAIDDFGTGYSSLAYLKRLPVDILKVDRMFVDGLGKSAEDGAIVAAIIGLADTLGLSSVAEGVETEEQLVALQALGCDVAQGFHLAAPLDSDGLDRFLDATYGVGASV
jgi:diguanylate cyclase (GGDEF)-like protein/PAS domain S-box-containing protein